MVVRRRGQLRKSNKNSANRTALRLRRSGTRRQSFGILAILGSLASIVSVALAFVAFDPPLDFKAEPNFSAVKVSKIKRSQWTNYRGKYSELAKVTSLPNWIEAELPPNDGNKQLDKFIFVFGNHSKRLEIGAGQVMDGEIVMAKFLDIGSLFLGIRSGAGKVIFHSDFEQSSMKLALAYVDLADLSMKSIKGGYQGKVFEKFLIADLERRVLMHWKVSTKSCDADQPEEFSVSGIELNADSKGFAFDVNSSCSRSMTWWVAGTKSGSAIASSVRTVNFPSGKSKIKVRYDNFGQIVSFDIVNNHA